MVPGFRAGWAWLSANGALSTKPETIIYARSVGTPAADGWQCPGLPGSGVGSHSRIVGIMADFIIDADPLPLDYAPVNHWSVDPVAGPIYGILARVYVGLVDGQTVRMLPHRSHYDSTSASSRPASPVDHLCQHRTALNRLT